MHRLLVEKGTLSEARPSLPREAAHHLKILRPDPDEAIELFDGHGRARTYRWTDRALVADGSAREIPPPSPLVLFACVTKGSRWDWTLEKATELGATRLVPVLSARTIVRLAPDERAAKRERWQRIVADAARQSDAAWLPEVETPVDFPEALRRAGETTCFAGALVSPPAEPLAVAVRRACADAAASARPFSVFVGPEGDFTREELDALLAVATPTSFGPTVLRAETAALYALSVVAAERAACEGGPKARSERPRDFGRADLRRAVLRL